MTMPTCQINEVQAAMCTLAGDVADAIHDHRQHRVRAAAALVHFGLRHRSVSCADLHHFQHLLPAAHIHLFGQATESMSILLGHA